MRVPQLVSDFFEWRWAPCVGLTAGSLSFVVLALLFIPTHFDGEPRSGATRSTFDGPRAPRALYASTLSPNLPETEPGGEDARIARAVPRSALPSTETAAPPARGFSPVLARPEPPAPVPSVAEQMPPAPGSVVVVQPVPGGESREVTSQ